MGISFSTNRRRNNYCYHHQNPHYHHLNPHYHQTPPPPPPLPPPSQLLSSSSSSSSSSSMSYPYPSDPSYPTRPPPPPNPYPTHPPPPIYSTPYYSNGYTTCNYTNHPLIGHSNYAPFYAYQPNGWPGFRPPPAVEPVPPPPPPPAYVEHQQAKKVRNDVNVHKDTLRVEVDELNPDHHLVSFVFDALFDGSFTIFYFAKEEANCSFVPLFPEAYVPVKIPFQKGARQKFCQPSGTGIDLGFFELDDLSKPSPEEDVFPLVISAETWLPSLPIDEHDDPRPNAFSHMQITQAVLEKINEDPFKVRVIKQILWIDGVRYELREIYGIVNSAESFNDNDSGKVCVICMTEPKDTAVLPCRHMCMCSECAKTLRLQSNNCPICRQPIEELIEIKINSTDE